MKVIIEKVYRKDQETKFGLRKSVSLKVKNQNLNLKDGSVYDNSDSKWISFLHKPGEFAYLDEWTDGMEVDIDITKNDKGYVNFEPKNEMVIRIEALEKAVFGGANKASATTATPDDDF